jgi:HD-GYP domain-containing protein (c-di-GMP phosphodiesterase class II)
MKMINEDPAISQKIKNMVETHHERIDGSGYPLGLKGEAIPLFGRIAAIVDCYDAITSERAYAKPLSSQEAVKRIYEWRGKDFQTELVEEFIQAIGMFPSGTLVELTNGEVGVVITESRTRRLRPKIMLILNADKSPREDFEICNLMERTHDEDGNSLDIKQALPEGSYDIKADDYFL